MKRESESHEFLSADMTDIIQGERGTTNAVLTLQGGKCTLGLDFVENQVPNLLVVHIINYSIWIPVLKQVISPSAHELAMHNSLYTVNIT